jgi:hypothetical protein
MFHMIIHKPAHSFCGNREDVDDCRRQRIADLRAGCFVLELLATLSSHLLIPFGIRVNINRRVG